MKKYTLKELQKLQKEWDLMPWITTTTFLEWLENIELSKKRIAEKKEAIRSKKGIDWSKKDMYEGIGRPELKPKP